MERPGCFKLSPTRKSTNIFFWLAGLDALQLLNLKYCHEADLAATEHYH